MYKTETFKTFEEWRLAHLHAIGGTSAGAIMGSNPYKNRIAVYRQFLGLDDDKHENNKAMEYGVNMEPLIRSEFKIDFPQYEVQDPNDYLMFRSVEYPFLIATCDGLLYDSVRKQNGILEIKTHTCYNDKDYEKWCKEPPEHYKDQIRHYMLVKDDTTFAIIVIMIRRMKGKTLQDKTIKYFYYSKGELNVNELLKEELDFYKNHIEKRIPPEVSISFF